MLFKLVLIIVLNGQSTPHVVEENLSREQCIFQMLEINKAFETKSFECHSDE